MSANTYERRAKTALSSLITTRDPFWHLAALVFLHELSRPETVAAPPDGLAWESLKGPRVDGEQVQRALERCEAEDPAMLGGLAARVQFAQLDAALLGAAMSKAEALCNTAPPTSHPADRFGALYMTTAGLSAQQAQGAFYTPDSVAQLVAMMAGDPQPADWVLDPAAGTGALLLAGIAHARRTLGEPYASAITFIGIELMERSAALANMNLSLMRAGHQAHVLCGNALSQPLCAPHPSDGELRTISFDRVLANPPFNSKVDLRHAPTDPLVIPDRLLNRPIAVPRADQRQAA